VKLGDSLGRSRRRRKKPAASSEAAGGPEAAGGAEAAAGEMVRPAGSSPVKGRLKGRNLVVAVGVLGLVGWVFGYGIATRVIFPAPPPPGDLFEVPDLRGLGLASASERLEGTGLDLGDVDSLQHPSVAAGLVLGQSPLPTQVARPNTEVRVTVSMGPQMRSVPDVVRLTEDRARVVLESSGFIVSMDTAEAEVPRGRVIEVSPPPDSVVPLPAQVRLLVSTGPPVIPMPLVLGLEQAEAEYILDSLGLAVSGVEEVFRFGRDQGVVVEQEPAADTDMRRGSGVRLKVGRRGLELEQ
jgi:beta-lactam-binding protein with PASTA domain